MNLILGIIFQFIFLFNSVEYKHPLHVTVTNIDYNANKKEFDVAIKLYIDDFQSCIYHNVGKTIDVSKADEVKKNESLISKYINNHLILKSKPSNKQILYFVKSVCADGSLWLYFSTKLPSQIKSLELTNSLMNDYYYDQTNLLFFNYNGKQEALSFDYNQTEKKITF